jgi:hypothetical protein
MSISHDDEMHATKGELREGVKMYNFLINFITKFFPLLSLDDTLRGKK